MFSAEFIDIPENQNPVILSHVKPDGPDAGTSL